MTDQRRAPADDKPDDIQMKLGQLLAAGYLSDNPPDLQRLAITTYKILGENRAPTFDDIGVALDITKERVAELFRLIPESAYEIDKDGEVAGFIGLSTVRAPHEFNLAGRKLYTWCAFDALFLPEILGETALLKSICPASGKSIELSVSPQGVTRAAPSSPVLSIVSPDIDACCADLRGAFCNEVNLFFNEEIFENWSENRTGIACVTLDTAMLLARQRNQARFPDIELI